jgi:hypothetical protein
MPDKQLNKYVFESRISRTPTKEGGKYRDKTPVGSPKEQTTERETETMVSLSPLDYYSSYPTSGMVLVWTG